MRIFLAFKEYSAEYLKLKESSPEATKVTEYDLSGAPGNSLCYFKLIAPEQLMRAQASSSIWALPPAVNWLSKQLISAILIGANFNNISGFKQHYVVKIEWDPSRMLDACETQVRYFKNPGHENCLSFDLREIDVSVFHDILKINMNTSTVVTWMRSMGYLVDYKRSAFKNVKGLHLNCAALKNLS